MSKRHGRVWLGLGGVGVVALGLAAALYAALNYRPSFYSELDAPGPDRHERAGQFVERTLQLRNDAANEDQWEAVFTQDQVNAWLAEDLPTQFPDVLPGSIRDPRIVFDAERATVAFAFEEGPLRGVLWAVVRVETDGDADALRFEVEEARLGLLPIPHGMIAERIRGGTRIPLTWSQENGHAVATVRIAPRRRGRALRVDDIQIARGRLRVAGRTLADEVTRQADATAPAPPAAARQRSL